MSKGKKININYVNILLILKTMKKIKKNENKYGGAQGERENKPGKIVLTKIKSQGTHKNRYVN